MERYTESRLLQSCYLEDKMQIQDKAHAATNYILGSVGITSPFWMQLISEATGILQFLAALGGAILIVIQLKRTLKK